jgi:hypothetical protein
MQLGKSLLRMGTMLMAATGLSVAANGADEEKPSPAERVQIHREIVENYFEAYNKGPERGYIDQDWSPKGFTDPYHLVLAGAWDSVRSPADRKRLDRFGGVATTEMRMYWQERPDMGVKPYRNASGFRSVEPGDLGIFPTADGVAAWMRWQSHDKSGNEVVFHEVDFFYTDDFGRINQWLSFANYGESRGNQSNTFGGGKNFEDVSFADYGKLLAETAEKLGPLPPRTERDKAERAAKAARPRVVRPLDQARVRMHSQLLQNFYEAYAKGPERGYIATDWAPHGFADRFHRVVVGSQRDTMITAREYDRRAATAEMKLFWEHFPDMRPVPIATAPGFKTPEKRDFGAFPSDNGAAAWMRWVAHDQSGKQLVFHTQDFFYTDTRGRITEWLTFVNFVEAPAIATSVFGKDFKNVSPAEYAASVAARATR